MHDNVSFAAGSEQEVARDVVLESVEFTGARGVLRGTLYRPDCVALDAKGIPAVLLSHGFGSNRLESGIFVSLGRALASSGVAAFAVDRTGQGESDGSFFDDTVERDVDDVERVLAGVRNREDVDADDVHLVGVSLGAVVTTIVAARNPSAIASISLLSTACSFADEIRSGYLQGKPLSVIDEQGYLDFYGCRLGSAIIDSANRIDPFGAARGYAGPVRILHGGRDFIPVEYVRRYESVYGRQAQLTIRPTADHGWANVTDREFAIAEVVRFIVERSRRSA
ncbi:MULTISPECIES: S9 family peptidase [unclassified Actinomyces]|uniref:alpha/beta hydrolase family protein n=1 Tax=unclassified Actinomyces TaxID=2609248 RepID=UPI00131EE69C|nr:MULTISPECIES: alpha/beta fold hydrolase [unclassified Actinomyces]